MKHKTPIYSFVLLVVSALSVFSYKFVSQRYEKKGEVLSITEELFPDYQVQGESVRIIETVTPTPAQKVVKEINPTSTSTPSLLPTPQTENPPNPTPTTPPQNGNTAEKYSIEDYNRDIACIDNISSCNGDCYNDFMRAMDQISATRDRLSDVNPIEVDKITSEMLDNAASRSDSCHKNCDSICTY